MTTAEQQAAEAREVERLRAEVARLRAALAEAQAFDKKVDAEMERLDKHYSSMLDDLVAQGIKAAEDRAAKAEAAVEELMGTPYGEALAATDRGRAEAAEAKLAATEADRNRIQDALADLQEGMVRGLERAQEREQKEREARKAAEAKLAEANEVIDWNPSIQENDWRRWKARAEALAKALEACRNFMVSATYKAPEQNPALYFDAALKIADAALAEWRDKP